MASPYQQQAFFRKIVYIVLILALAFATYVLRESAGGWSIQRQAEDLGVREESLGDVELIGSLARLTLTGSRGLTVCALWIAATKKQMKHEWNELELLVDTLTKLQPHFITPWLFQSWNLSYNVAVESDRVKDKYFYIARGINLLAEGERRNRNNPDLRHQMGFYNEHKIGMSDESDVERCLYQMSCIDPKERDPKRLRTVDDKGNTIVNLAKFEEFCQRHPFLVRRLREALRVSTPSEIVDFLADNQNIPSRFEDSPSYLMSDSPTPLKAETQRFPVLVPATPWAPDPADPSAIDFDNFMVARDWMAYAQEPLPPPKPPDGPVMRFDRTKYRLPKYTAIIFRNSPARAQTYVAEFLEKEGWFDGEGWKIEGDWFPDDKFSTGKEAVVGGGVNWAERAWSRSHDMWLTYGDDNGLHLSPEALKDLEDKAEPFRKRHKLTAADSAASIPLELLTTADMKGREAHERLYWRNHFEYLTNFPHYYFTTQVEKDASSIALRKTFDRADRFKKKGEREAALALYREAIPKWRALLLAHKDFREDDDVQETTYGIEMTYMGLVQDVEGNQLKQLAFFGDCLGDLAVLPSAIAVWIPPWTAARNVSVKVHGPFDYVDSAGKPLIPLQVKNRVHIRLKLPELTRDDTTPVPAQ